MAIPCPRRRVHDAADRVHQLRPAVVLARQLRLAGRGQLVVLRPLVGLADAHSDFSQPRFSSRCSAG